MSSAKVEPKEESIDGLVNIVSWLWCFRAPVYNLVGTILFFLIGLYLGIAPEDDKHKYICWVLGLAFIAILCVIRGSILGFAHEENRVALQKQRDESFQELKKLRKVPVALLENFLIYLSKELKLSNEHRVSLYLHMGSSFHRLGRFSKNPKYNKAGRKLYPDTEGCISDAWQNGESMVYMPDPGNWADYKNELATKYNIKALVADNLTMLSRSYVGLRLTDPRNNKHIGVIVFESTKVKGVSLNSVRKVFDKSKEEELAKYLSEFLPWLQRSE